jgi:hypothetical protein
MACRVSCRSTRPCRSTRLVCTLMQRPRTSANARTGEALSGGTTYTLTLRPTRPETPPRPRVGEPSLAGTTDNPRPLHTFQARPRPPHGISLFGRQDPPRQDPQPMLRSPRPENDPEHTHGRSPVWREDLQADAPAPHVPRTIADPRLAVSLFGRQDSQRQDPQPMLRSPRPENDRRPSHGRSPVWRADPRCSYERSVASRTLRVAARLGWSFLITP